MHAGWLTALLNLLGMGGGGSATTLTGGRVFYFAGRAATAHAATGTAPAFAFRGSVDNLDR